MTKFTLKNIFFMFFFVIYTKIRGKKLNYNKVHT